MAATEQPTSNVSSLTANQKQFGGDHYKQVGIEPWDYIEANGLGFLDGTAVKYLTRWKKKGGIVDLQKAIHFIEKLIEVEKAKVAPVEEPKAAPKSAIDISQAKMFEAFKAYFAAKQQGRV